MFFKYLATLELLKLQFMRKLSFVLLLVSISAFSNAQQKSDVIHSTVLPIEFHGETGRLDEFVEATGTINEITKKEKLGYSAKSDWVGNTFDNPNALPQGDDPVWQQDYAPAAPATKAMGVGWNGMGYTSVNPADPSVDVGPNHVVQMINGGSGAYIRIYTKAGAPIGTQVYFDNFMAMPGGAGDPIVMYDERANRWFLSEFSATGNNLHVAISTTPDPGGTYYKYTFNSPGGFPDYPKYSIWANEYVMTANVNTPDIFALNRTAMLAGTPTTAQMFSQTNFGTIGFQASTPVSMNGTALPPAGAPALLMRMRDDAWAGAATDALEMWNLTVNWTTPASSTLAQVQTLATAPHDSGLCGYTSFQCFPQPGTSVTLDPLRELLMNRIHYRNFGTHESIVCCHVTDVTGADRGGIRWYELRRTGGLSGTWSIYQQGTYSPDAVNRWMPSIGISASGNIGIAYSAANGTTVYPSLRYTGRKSCDPLGTMTEPETVLIAGTASNASNRWGDYFQLGCDPTDGETFWHTGCFNTSANWSTRISSFDIASCSAQVSFATNTYSVNEGAGVTVNPSSACLPYVDVIVPISIGSAPSQNASIVVSATGGTATNNVDYTVLNGTLTLNSSNLTANVTVRVYNDSYAEGNETIILSYTLNANGGNAIAGTLNQSVTITIVDNDFTPAASTNTSVILTQNFESGFGGFSTVNNGLATATAWQIGNNAAASSTAYAIPTSNTTNFAWINDDACNCNQSSVDLVFPSINLTGYSSANLAFDSYFEDNTYQAINENADVYVSVNGGANILIGPLVASAIDVSWTAQSFNLTPYVGNANVVLKIRYSDGGGWLYGCTVDNVSVTGAGPIAVQSAVNTATGMTGNLGPNGTVHFYDPTSGNVMLTLANTTSFNYGCVTVEVDRAGTGAVQFNNAITANYLTSKTFKVTPTNANPTGAYTATLYYKEAEVAGWEAATGNVRSAAKIVKVSGNNQILSVNPGNAGSFAIGDAATTIGAFNGDVTFTAPFTTGFSGFGVGVYNPATGSAPVASFTGTPTSICAGQTVTFTDASTNTPTSWSWNFGDATSSTLQNPSHVYATAGNYTVSLTATNGNGSNTSTQTNYITVNAVPVITSSRVNSTTCTPPNGTMTVSGTGTGVVSWTGTTSGSSGSVTLPYTLTGLGAGTYTATFTSAAGCISNTTSQTITIPANPTITSSRVNSTTCSPPNGTMTVSGTGTGVVNWTGPTSGTSGTVTLPYIITGLGAGTFTATFTSSGGCVSNSTSRTITVPANPTITSTGNNPTACATTTGSIVVSGTGTGTVAWSGTASGTSATITLPYTITGLGAGTYSIAFTTSGGCVSNTLTTTLTDPSAPTVTATGTATICSGQSTTISASGATTYSWNNGAATAATATVSPTTTTTYIVTGTTGGCSNTASVTITVNPTPTVTATGTATICAGQSTTISAGGATSYSWNNGAGTAATTTVSPTTATTYTVTGTTSGCTSTASVTITVNPAPTVTATGTATICPGQSTTISAGGATTYSWNNGAGTSATASVSPTATTTYTVTGTTSGCTNTAQVTVTVNPNPTIALGTVTNPNTCATTTGSIQVTGSGTGNVSWTGTASSSATGVSLPYTVSGLGVGSYSITFVSAVGCSSNTVSQGLSDPTPPTPPTITASGPTTFCAGGTVTLTSSYASGNTWNTMATSQAIAVTSSGTYSVVYTNGSGCSAASAPITVTVNPFPTVAATGTATICAGQPTSISASGATTYSWNNGAGTSATASVSPTSTTTYTVTGTTAGCTNTASVTITVNPTPTVTATGTSTICSGQSTTISASGATTYSWNNGAGTAATATVSPTTTTTYTVTGTTSGCSSTAQVTITVGSATSSSQSVSLCPGQSVTVGTSTYNSAGTYTDVISGLGGCDSTVTTTVSMLSVTSSTENVDICAGSSYTVLGNTYTTSGTYTNVTTNAAGCDSTVTTVLTVNANPTVSITPTTIDSLCTSDSPITLVGTPGGGVFSGTGVIGSVFDPAGAGVGTHTITYSYTDGNGCNGTTTVIAIVTDCSAGVHDVGLEGVSLFPNPNEGIFMISGLAIGTEFEIFDERGRLVANGTTKAAEQEVELLQVQTGIYYLYATQNGVRGTLKFLITK